MNESIIIAAKIVWKNL